MKDSMSRLLLCLAALDLTEYELSRLMNEFRSVPWEEISARVALIQKHNKQSDVYESASRLLPKKSSSASDDASVGERVERLLKLDARLTTAQAVEKLAKRLSDLGLLDRGDIPPLVKKSFRHWIARLGQKVPAKEILRCATIIRNEYVHSPARDWMLSGSEEK